MMNKQSETVWQFQQGNEQAYAELYDQFSQRLYYFAMRFVEHSAEAEDIVSEAFLKLWARRDQFPSEDAIVVFLHRTIKNRCLDYLKHESIKHKKEPYLIHMLSETTDADFSDEMIRLELMKQIYAEVDRLPEKMKEVFYLSYKEGLKPAAIAELLQINVQTVKNQRINAIKLLKNALKDKPLLIAYLVWLDHFM